jgi:hypothetical protein
MPFSSAPSCQLGLGWPSSTHSHEAKISVVGLADRSLASFSMNTASELGPHTQADRGTCPGVGL